MNDTENGKGAGKKVIDKILPNAPSGRQFTKKELNERNDMLLRALHLGFIGHFANAISMIFDLEGKGLISEEESQEIQEGFWRDQGF